MKSRVSASQAARSFSDLLNRVIYRGEEFVIVRGQKPVCEVSGVRPPPRSTLGGWLEVMKSSPPPDDLFFDEIAAVLTNQPGQRGDPWAQ